MSPASRRKPAAPTQHKARMKPSRLAGAFNTTTGPAHWELLQKARAVDNQLFVATCSPARNPEASYQAWGHSTAVDPFGKASPGSPHCLERSAMPRLAPFLLRRLLNDHPLCVEYASNQLMCCYEGMVLSVMPCMDMPSSAVAEGALHPERCMAR